MKLEFTQEQLVVIGNALSDAPFKVAAPVIQEIQKQINEQQNANQPTGTTENSTT